MTCSRCLNAREREDLARTGVAPEHAQRALRCPSPWMVVASVAIHTAIYGLHLGAAWRCSGGAAWLAIMGSLCVQGVWCAQWLHQGEVRAHHDALDRVRDALRRRPMSEREVAALEAWERQGPPFRRSAPRR